MGMFGAIGGMFGGGGPKQPFQKKNPMGPSMNSPYSMPPPGQRGVGARAGAMGQSPGQSQRPTQIPYGQPQQQQKEWTNPGIAHPGAQVWQNSGYQQPPQMPPQKPYQSTFNRPSPQIQPQQGYQTSNPYNQGRVINSNLPQKPQNDALYQDTGQRTDPYEMYKRTYGTGVAPPMGPMASREQFEADMARMGQGGFPGMNPNLQQGPSWAEQNPDQEYVSRTQMPGYNGQMTMMDMVRNPYYKQQQQNPGIGPSW